MCSSCGVRERAQGFLHARQGLYPLSYTALSKMQMLKPEKGVTRMQVDGAGSQPIPWRVQGGPACSGHCQAACSSHRQAASEPQLLLSAHRSPVPLPPFSLVAHWRSRIVYSKRKPTVFRKLGLIHYNVILACNVPTYLWAFRYSQAVRRRTLSLSGCLLGVKASDCRTPGAFPIPLNFHRSMYPDYCLS